MATTFFTLKNWAETTVAVAVNGSATEITVTSAAALQAAVGYAQLWNETTYPDPVDDPGREVVRIDSVLGNVLTVTRGQCGTSGAAHAVGDVIKCVWLAENATQMQTAINARVQKAPDASADNEIQGVAVGVVTLALKAFAAQTAALLAVKDSAGAALLTVEADGDVVLADGKTISGGSTTGTKIGTVATQKLALFGVTPVVQPAGAGQATVTMGNANGEIAGLTFSATPTQAECNALRDKCEELADDVRAVLVLVHALRTAGVDLGSIKGAA